MTPITILITTFYPPGAQARYETARRAVESWGTYLSLGPFHIVIADDGSSEQFSLGTLADHLIVHGSALLSSTVDRATAQGVGASLNRGVALAPTDLIMYAVDDWRTDEYVDLWPWADILMENPDVGCVRFFPHPHLKGGRIRNFAQGWAVEFDREGYYWAQRPALYHRRFFEAYGPFPEGVSALDVDEQYNAHVCASDGKRGTIGPSVILALPQSWRHLEDDTVELGDLMPGQAIPPERLNSGRS